MENDAGFITRQWELLFNDVNYDTAVEHLVQTGSRRGPPTIVRLINKWPWLEIRVLIARVYLNPRATSDSLKRRSVAR